MADSFTIEIFQIQENAGETDIEVVAGTLRTYDSDVAMESNDIFPVETSELIESLEFDEGVYTLSNQQVSLFGLAETYFNTYGDMINAPYVFVLTNKTTSTVLFHGLIDRTSIDWNASTKITAFEVFSWEFILDQVNAAARSVFKTELFSSYEETYTLTNSRPAIQVPRFVGGVDLSAVIDFGDVVVFETDVSEHRGIVQGKATGPEDVLLTIDGPPQTAFGGTHTVGTGDVEHFVVISATSAQNMFRATITNATLWSGLSDVRIDEFVNAVIDLPTSGPSFIQLFPEGTTQTDAAGRPTIARDFFKLDPDQQTVFVYFRVAEGVIDEIKTGGVDITISSQTQVNAGTPVRILGKDVYGFSPVDFNANYEVDEVIQAVFSLADVGVLTYIVNTFTFPAGYSQTFPKWIEFPTNLLESLREMQNSKWSFIKFIPSVDVSGLPRLELELIERTSANTTDLSTTALADVISWTEKGGDLTPPAVVVRPTVKYFEPVEEGDTLETVGFWYDGLDLLTPELTGFPSGEDVVEIKINATPAWTGDIFYGNDKAVRNDVVLLEIAKKFYNFYNNLSRPVEFSVDGLVGDVVGQFVTVSEGGLTRTVFVTERSIDPVALQTKLKGRIGEWNPSETGNPVAVISGVLNYVDLDGGGDEDILLSGLNSYDPLGDSITFEWRVNGGSVISTSPMLSTTLAVGTHSVELTVTRASGGTDTETVSVEVIEDNTLDDGGTALEAAFTQQSVALNASNDVLLTAAGDSRTQTTAGIRVETKIPPASYAEIAGSPFDNPQTNLQIHTALAFNTQLDIRVTLINASDGMDGAAWETSITNGNPGSNPTFDSLTVNNGSVTFDLPGGESFVVDINSNNILSVTEALIRAFVAAQFDSTVDIQGALTAAGADFTGSVDVVGDLSGGTLAADNGFSGTFIDNDGNTITVVSGIITSLAAPTTPTQWLYYSESQDETVRKIKTDGTSDQEVVSLVGNTNGGDLRGISVDDLNGHVYVAARSTTNKVIRIDLDGTNITEILTSADGLGDPTGLVVIPGASAGDDVTLVVGDDNGINKWTVTTAGSASGKTSIKSGVKVHDVAYDAALDRVFYVDATNDDVRRVDLDGTGDALVEGSPSGTGIWGIDVDTANEVIFFTSLSSNQRIEKVNYDGTGLTDVITNSSVQYQGIFYDQDDSQKLFYIRPSSRAIREIETDGTNDQELVNHVSPTKVLRYLDGSTTA